ncbi:MAG TPA: MBL fold metallo-hydrolase [Sphingomicrobium sp.]|nr:MBL fold metallo-hydrolase [Sphingomicrobium sp.]
MRPLLHARLINGRFGDPTVFVETLHRREALLFDAGDLSALSTRDLLRIDHVLLTHLHMDHFIGFDALLRANVGRSKTIRVIAPPRSGERLEHKLRAYEWDLVDGYANDLLFEVIEYGPDGPQRAARFRLKRGFVRECIDIPGCWDRIGDTSLDVAFLEHHGPCLGFALCEPAHANVWKNRLLERGLTTGAWLRTLKSAVLEGQSDHKGIRIADDDVRPLSALRDLVTISRGQKIAYVTDVADTPSNRAAIVKLAWGADLFFLESRFAGKDEGHARDRAHLTTKASGEIARAANVRRYEPFHFSARYEGEEERMLAEADAAFRSSARGV